MSKTKKIISLLLSVIMIMSVFNIVPLGVSAAEADIAETGAESGTTGDCTWTLDDNGVLTISGNGKMEDYYSPWNDYDFNTVVIGNGVKSIGDYAFNGCTGLTSVTIPNSVTSIGKYAFSYCTLLKSVAIPDSVTSIGDEAFYGCTGLTNVHISDIAAWCDISFSDGCSNPLIYAYALYLNGSLITDLVIPDSVTSIGDKAFDSCTGLTSVTIPDSVTSIGNRAFYGCAGLKSVTIPDSVTSIGDSAFSGCSGLTSIDIPDSVTNIGDSAFRGCTSLTSVTIPDSVTSIGSSAFYGCTELTSVTIPDSVTSIDDEAFRGCTGLTGIDIPDSVTSIGVSTFYNCTGLTSIKVAEGNTVYDSRNDCNAIINTESNKLIYGCKNTVIPDSVTSIGGSAFSGCTGMSSITIPDSVTSIGGGAFSGCTGLTSVDIPDSVTSIGNYTFSNCTSLTSVTIGSSVTIIGGFAFFRCIGLTSVTIPDSVTNIRLDAFSCCTSLTSVTIPDSVTSVGDRAFGYNYDEENPQNKKIDGFTIYGYKGSEAEKYAVDNGFTFVPLNSKTDEATGIILDIPEEIDLTVKDITAEIICDLPDGCDKKTAYDISLTKDGEAFQPDNIVTVKIPCTNGNAKVYRFEADSTMTDMNAKYKDGYMVFTTDHFSVYVLAEPNEKTGMTVKGTVTSYIDDTEVTVKLTGADNNFTAEVKGTDSYEISAVPAGKYTLTVSKANHVTAEYTVTVADTDVTQDVKLSPKGDVNGDGKTNAQDCTAILRYVRKIDTGLSDYQLKCADVTGDGKTNVQDVTRILRHVRKIEALY